MNVTENSLPTTRPQNPLLEHPVGITLTTWREEERAVTHYTVSITDYGMMGDVGPMLLGGLKHLWEGCEAQWLKNQEAEASVL